MACMGEAVTMVRDGDVAVIRIDEPPVNAATDAVCAGLAAALDAIEADAAIRAAVILCGGKGFVAGADIKAMDAVSDAPPLPDLIDRIETFDKPVLAAIHGPALGGGLELALACHGRIASADARFGLPEVRLGLIPGGGGTQRLPRLAGIGITIDLAVDGREIDAATALSVGLIDAIAEAPLREAAIDHASALAGEPPRRTRDLAMPADGHALVEAAAPKVAKKARGRRAPLLALDAIRFGLDHPFDEALANEKAVSIAALRSDESRALRHLFLAERRVRRDAADAPPRPIATVGVVGLGTMGRGIVQALAAAGVETIAVARSDASLAKAQAAVEKAWAKLGDTQSAARVRWSSDLTALSDADLVIESIGEAMADKVDLFAALGSIAKPGAILASNTSYLDVDALAAASGRAADVAGLHFFNPANVMRLVEVVAGAATAPDVVATLMGFARQIGKIAILSGVCDGFVVNRLLAKRSREAYFLLEEGASPYAVDRVITGFGFPMGPFALGDLAGIDVQRAARIARADRLSPREHRADFVDQLFAAGRLGRRAGKGWYAYGEDGKPAPDPEIDALVSAHGARHGVAQRAIGEEEIRDRLILAMVNEGAKLIDEGIVAGPDAIDIALVHGIGFPAHLGGPMWWADRQGLTGVATTVTRFAAEQGNEYWQPATGLLDRATQDRGFY